MIRFEDLIEKVKAANPDADTEILRRAYVFSAYEHKGQVRRSGEPYLVHPLEVADMLADMRLDPVAVAAGLLHDIVEDTPNTIEKIRDLFGEQVAHVVEGVTKISQLSFSTSEERQAETYRKMLLANYPSRDPQVNFEHAARQAYIALGAALISAAFEEVDATPMEGFVPPAVDDILGLTARGLRSVSAGELTREWVAAWLASV